MRPMRSAVATLLALAVLAAALAPDVALGDADPASDVLLGAAVFYPFSPTVSPGLQRVLSAETAAAANRAQFPVKVALIHSPADLGAIPTLFAMPQQYADFLDQEITFRTASTLLVVMPNGYGVVGLGPAGERAVAPLKKPGGGPIDDLARAAILALPRLAAADGHPIGAVPAAGSDTSSTPTLAIAAIVAAAAITIATTVLAIRQRRASTRGRRRQPRRAHTLVSLGRQPGIEERRGHGRVRPPRPDQGRHARAGRGMRGVPGHRRDLGRAAGLPGVRPRRLLRFLAGCACHPALQGNRPSDHELGHAGRHVTATSTRPCCKPRAPSAPKSASRTGRGRRAAPGRRYSPRSFFRKRPHRRCEKTRRSKR